MPWNAKLPLRQGKASMSYDSKKEFVVEDHDEKTYLAVHSAACMRSALDRGEDITFSFHSPGKIRFEQHVSRSGKARPYRCGDERCPAAPGTNLGDCARQ